MSDNTIADAISPREKEDKKLYKATYFVKT